MSMTESSNTYFKQNASRWDDLQNRYFTTAVRDAAIARAYLRPEMVVADVGAGTGFLSAGLAPLVRRVIAVDGSAAMLEVARKKLAAFENIQFEHADGQSIPVPDDSLDAVFANMYLHHCTDPLAAIREMARILRPGGRLVLTDMDSHPYAWLKDEMADVWQGFDRADLRRWFREAGLVNIITDCTGQSCCAESENPQITDEQGRQASISVFVAVGTKPVAGVEEAVQADYGAAAEGRASCCSSAAQAECSCCGSGSTDSSCCGSSTKADYSIDRGYYAAEQQDAPAEAAEISLGCGNPIAMAGLQPGEVVLDIGSGGGLDSFLAAKRISENGHVIGVDMTPAMIERARSTAEKNGYTNVEFRPGYADALPVEDGSVDVIMSNCVINLTRDKGRVFEEAFRVLKNGGRLEVSDMVTDGGIPGDLRENPANWPGCVYGALPEGEYIDLIRQAGFGDVIVRRSSPAGEESGVKLYSINVSAKKGAQGGTDVMYTMERKRLARPGSKSCCG